MLVIYWRGDFIAVFMSVYIFGGRHHLTFRSFSSYSIKEKLVHVGFKLEYRWCLISILYYFITI